MPKVPPVTIATGGTPRAEDGSARDEGAEGAEEATVRGFDMPENLAHDPGCIKGARMVIIRSKMIQTNEPLETAELQAFVRTVTARSLTRAAGELKVPRATLGRRLARLEEKLGRRLLRRTTRTLALTDAGQAFFPRARAVLDAVAEAEASVEPRTHGALRGDLA